MAGSANSSRKDQRQIAKIWYNDEQLTTEISTLKEYDMNEHRKKITKHLQKAKLSSKAKTAAAKDKAKTIVGGELPPEQSPDRITNDTVMEHRKQVLHGAKRFVYPLSHSKHKIAIISSLIFLLLVTAVTATATTMLYRYQRTDDFAYRITEILPLPIARVNGNFVSYENYLFEVRQNVHFYANQENINFEDPEGQAILANVRSESLQRVKENALARQIADENGITVSSEEVDEQIAIFREQGGITSSEEAFENTLQEFYGWSQKDLRRVLELQLLKQKLVTVLDSSLVEKANAVVAQARAEDADFDALALESSDDQLTRENGGKLGIINRTNTDLPPQFLEVAFSLEEGQVSDLVQTPFGYHVIKHLGNEETEGEIRVAHIFFQFTPIEETLAARLADATVSDYITPKDDRGTTEAGGQSQPQQDDIR